MTFESAIHRAAILVKSLSPDQAKQLLSRLEAEELQKVFQRIRAIGEVSPEDKRLAAETFVRSIRQIQSTQIPCASKNVAAPEPFEFLRDVSAAVAFDLLKDQHPGDVAIVMTFLPAQLAADTLSHFEANARVIVLRKICKLESLNSECVIKISNRLEVKLARTLDANCHHDIGMDTATRLLSCTDPFTRTRMLDELDSQDSQLSGEIQQLVLSFQDLMSWDENSIKQLLPWIDTSLWAPAIKNSSPAMQRKILSCFGERPRILLKRELGMMDSMGSLMAEQARSEIVRAIIKLVDEGKVTLPNPGLKKSA